MRRTRVDVICAILVALENGSMRPTPLMSKANLPHHLFKKYIADMEGAGLIRQVTVKKRAEYALTEQGISYVSEYHRFLKFSEGFGL
jgi:predicted transcriptional regulator